jgi:hypothetical protein
MGGDLAKPSKEINHYPKNEEKFTVNSVHFLEAKNERNLSSIGNNSARLRFGSWLCISVKYETTEEIFVSHNKKHKISCLLVYVGLLYLDFKLTCKLSFLFCT